MENKDLASRLKKEGIEIQDWDTFNKVMCQIVWEYNQHNGGIYDWDTFCRDLKSGLKPFTSTSISQDRYA